MVVLLRQTRPASDATRTLLSGLAWAPARTPRRAHGLPSYGALVWQQRPFFSVGGPVGGLAVAESEGKSAPRTVNRGSGQVCSRKSARQLPREFLAAGPPGARG